MRIIAKERDYYDCIQAQGQDLTCVWVRKLEEVMYEKKVKSWPFKKFSAAGWRSRSVVHVNQYVIGFCGKIYHVLGVATGFFQKEFFCYSLEDFDNFVKDHYNDKEIKIYQTQKSRRYHHPKGDAIGVRHKEVREFFEKAKEDENSFENIFVENGCPVFVAKRVEDYRDYNLKITYHGRREDPERTDDGAKEIERNSSSSWYNQDFYMLKDFEFYRIFPTQQAFQEIWQYISGVLGANNPDVPVPDDETMRDIKGFDNWSFKKMPTKKK